MLLYLTHIFFWHQIKTRDFFKAQGKCKFNSNFLLRNEIFVLLLIHVIGEIKFIIHNELHCEIACFQHISERDNLYFFFLVLDRASHVAQKKYFLPNQ